MTNEHSDIDTLRHEIVRLSLMINDPSIEREVREYTLTEFIARDSELLIALLDELKSLRDQISGSVPIGGYNKSHRVILEGYSDSSSEKALSNALDKASHYFSEDNDIAITLQQLLELPSGGHRAVIVVHITPITLKEKPHIKGADIELKRDHDKAFHASRNKENEALQHLVFDHFSALTKAKTTGHVPPSFLINVTDAKLMSYILEKQFLKAELSLKDAQHDLPEPTPEFPHQIKVHVRREHE